jgi:hypothetical protein
VAKSGTVMYGDQFQSVERAAVVAGSANAHVLVSTMAIAATNWSELFISLARVQYPTWNGLGDDDHRERKAEDDPEHDLKMRPVHWTNAFVISLTGDVRECSPACSETAQSNKRANYRDDVQHIVVSGRARVLLKHVAEAKIAGPGERPGEHNPPDQRRRFSLPNCIFKVGHNS